MIPRRASLFVFAAGIVSSLVLTICPRVRADSVSEPPQSRSFASRHDLDLLISLSSARLHRELSLSGIPSPDAQTHSELDSLWKPLGVWGGVRMAYGQTGRLRGWQGDWLLGVDWAPHTFSGLLGLAHSTSYWIEVRPGLGLAVGLRGAVEIAPGSRELAHGTVGIPMTIAWRRVELAWSPGLVFPLAHVRERVFDGELRRGIALHFEPLAFHVAIRLF